MYTGSNKRGSIFIIAAFAAVFILGMTALVTDVGFLYFNQARLQTAVNAGWKAGYDRMLQISQGRSLPTLEHQEEIKSHIIEVMKHNGYSDDELKGVSIEFAPRYHLKVASTQRVGLFFARIVNFSSSDVSASRKNHADDVGQGVVPLAIPHGVTKDLSRNAYACELFSGEGGFASGTEYILKLGSGGGNIKVSPEDIDPRMIFVPMDSASQSNSGFLLAYGAVFWCLRYDNSDPGIVPVMWLIGYRGGSFMMPFNTDLEKLLGSYGVNYQIISGADNIQWYYDQANPNIIELFNRPRIAVHSGNNRPGPLDLVLTEAKIPFGIYSLPPALNSKGFQRGNYSISNNSLMTDAEVLAGGLGKYHVAFTHNQDYTGFSGGCSHYGDDCETFLINNRLGATKNSGLRSKVKSSLCNHCQQFYDTAANIDFQNAAHRNNYDNNLSVKNSVWTNAYESVKQNCANKNRRCVEKNTLAGTWWHDVSDVTMCGDTSRPQCQEFKGLITAANAQGFSSDAGSMPKPQHAIDMSGLTDGLMPDADGWFNKANAVQKMKWAVAQALSGHAEAGGFLFAQSLSAESLELALLQKAVYDGKFSSDPFAYNIAFDNFAHRLFPARNENMLYSTIGLLHNSTNQPISLNFNLDPRCQNHNEAPDTGFGLTSVFNPQTMRAEFISLGYLAGSDGKVKYLKGQRGYGEITYLGGEQFLNTASKRLILNNLLWGAMTEKFVDGENFTPVAGRQKSNYGPVDPDNYTGGGANDYRDRFMAGFNSPLEVNDRLIAESGNMRGPTDQSVEFRINGDLEIPPSRRVIVPITDIPPEVMENNPHNAGARTLYDLQGNDQPDGAYRPEAYGFTSAVRIIGFAEFEILDPSEYTRDGEYLTSGDAGDLGPYQPGQVRGRFIRYLVKPGDAPTL